MWAVGNVRSIAKPTIDADGALSFTLRQRRAKKGSPVTLTERVFLRVKDGRLMGKYHKTSGDGSESTERFSGKRLPPLPARPDLSKVRFAKPIRLFNGKDLSGWRLSDPDKKQGWSVRDGILTNDTPKKDFSAYGEYGNLRTDKEFEDFKLHIEFRVGENCNSGIYLRGMYEAQVVDRDSRMQGMSGVGAIFGRIAPSKNAGKPGGEWQTYDITLVDRHVTIVLNGQTVIDNQAVEGPTGGALIADVTRPGPVYLQGDHTSVEYRNIIISPTQTD